MQTLIEMLTNDTSVSMQYEIAIMLCAFFVSSICIKGRKMLIRVWLGIFLFFIYIHRVLLPFIISGAYLMLICCVLWAAVRMDAGEFFTPVRALGKSIKVYTAGPVLPCTAVILTILLIQLCRLNIAVDYDSLRYGLRSDVLLTNGEGLRGFFENTGLVNSVYLYPKGFELITRPLYFGGTLGNILCVNAWVLIGVILLAGEIAGLLTGQDYARVFAAMMTALIPGITNMSVTAKSDLCTLLCQMGFVYCAVRFLKTDGKENAGLLTGAGTGLLILSYSFKTTAVVFSSVLGLTSAFFFLYKKKKLPVPDRGGLRALLLSVMFTGTITARTLVITGQPFSGVFTRMFESLGMELKYPFRSQSFMHSDEAVRLSERISSYLGRLAAFFVCPAGEDMSHVIMAWGGIAFLLLTLVLLCCSHVTGERMEKLNRLSEATGAVSGFASEAFRFIRLIWIVEGIVSLVSLYLLYQVDGNYFMLIYALSAAAGTAVYFTGSAYEESGLNISRVRLFSGGNSAALILLCGVMIYITAFTGWCGPVGFTKADLLNRGYFDHENTLLRDYHIWDRDARVIALAEEPECYELKGRIESWVDIDGSGGNVYLTDTKLNIFKDYLEFADIDYIYADLDYIYDQGNARRIRAGVLFEYLLEDGCFEELTLIGATGEVPGAAQGETRGAGREVAARLDKERTAVDWEVPVSEEIAARTERQIGYFSEICPEYASDMP